MGWQLSLGGGWEGGSHVFIFFMGRGLSLRGGGMCKRGMAKVLVSVFKGGWGDVHVVREGIRGGGGEGQACCS